MEGSGAEHVRLRLSTAALGPPWQVPEQGPQGPQAAQAPCVGQTCLVSQAFDSCASPVQWPPHLGVGRLHARRRIWVPPEQVTEQAVQGPQSDQPPISGQHGWSSQACSCHWRVPGSTFSGRHWSSQPMQCRCRSWEPSVQVTEQGVHADHGDHCGSLHAIQSLLPGFWKA